MGTALAYALVGGYQWLTRDVFWNPSVKVFNAYAPFFRVNSVFWDPSVYGRYLTVAILASLAGILLGGIKGWRVAGLYGVVVATWLGLLISFSQSSFVALAAGIVVAVAVAWGRSATLALVALCAVTAAVVLAVPQVRDELVGKSRSGFNRITSGRANLVGQGVRIAVDHPVVGVGAGGFSREYARRLGIPGRDPKRVASHTTPITVAAEGGRRRAGAVRLAARGRVPLDAAGARAGGSRPGSRSRRASCSWRSSCTASSTPRSSRTR